MDTLARPRRTRPYFAYDRKPTLTIRRSKISTSDQKEPRVKSSHRVSLAWHSSLDQLVASLEALTDRMAVSPPPDTEPTIDEALQQLQKLVNECNGHQGKAKELRPADIECALPALTVLLKEATRKDQQRSVVALLRSILECRPRKIAKQRATLFVKNRQLLMSLLSFEELIAKQTSDQLVVRIGEASLECLESLYVILSKIAAADDRYGTKLRSLNSKSVLTPLVQLRKWSVIKGSGKLVTAILCYVKKVCSSCTNVATLVWGSMQRPQVASVDVGIVTPLFGCLASHKLTSPTAVAAGEVLALVLRSREGILTTLEPSRGQMAALRQHVTTGLKSLDGNSNGKHSININRALRFTHAMILCLLHVAYIRPGRQALISLDVISLVHPLAKKLVTMSGPSNKVSKSSQAGHAQRLLLMVSILIQRCLDPMKLPYEKLVLSHPSQELLPASVVALSADAKRAAALANSGANPSAREIYADEYFCNSDSSGEEEDDENELTTLRDKKIDNDSCSCSRRSSFSPTSDELNEDLTAYAKFFPEIGRSLAKKVRRKSRDASTSRQLSRPNIKGKPRLSDLLLCTCTESSSDRSQSSSPVELTSLDEGKALVFDRQPNTDQIETVDWRQAFDACTERTKSFSPIVKQAEWLLHEPKGNDFLEPLANDPGECFWATKLLEHIDKRLFGEARPISVLVFDLTQDPCQRTRTTLKFESRFESGNLRQVIQTGPSEYTLMLNSDLGTRGHGSWFYFEVQNMTTRSEYTFNIINCEKQSGLFNDGMRPLLYSKACAESGRSGWRRTTGRAAYYRNHYVEDDSLAAVMSGKAFHTLTFSVQFPNSMDTCYLAYNYPYPYSLLETHTHFWLNSARLLKTILFEKQTLCYTISGNPVPVFTITSRLAPSTPSFTDYILLMARVHPSETCASWMLKGCMDYLLSERPEAIDLRKRYVFKIIPMLNPDGVIYGSTRTSLSGEDLNRQWRKPDIDSHPEIYHARRLVRWLLKNGTSRRLAMICDLHGHSRRKNIFMYGCTSALSWKRSDRAEASCGCDGISNAELIFPLLLDEVAPSFSFEDSSFVIEKSRETTARVAFWRDFRVPLSYTMEASMGACDTGPYSGNHLGMNQLTEMGERFCEAIGMLRMRPLEADAQRLVPTLPEYLGTQFADRLRTLSSGFDSSNSEDEEEGAET